MIPGSEKIRHFQGFRDGSSGKEESSLTSKDWWKYDQGVPLFERVIFVNTGPVDHKNQKWSLLKRQAFGQNTHRRPHNQFHFAYKIFLSKPS